VTDAAASADLAMEVGSEFIRVARKELRQANDRVGACIRKLSSQQIWHRDHAIENSVGNLVLHLAGNVRQWIVSGVAGEEDRRDRDWEFATRDPLPAAKLRDRLTAAVDAADAVLADLPPERLVETRRIQVYEVTVVHAIAHVLTHFAGHAGQIIWATKHVTGKDLGFYGYLKKGSGGPARHSP
jgi:uncharacterized damage-inducible protein DinB